MLTGLRRPLPVHKKGDGILGLLMASQAGGNALGRGCRHLDGDVAELSDHGLADVNVMRVKIVADVGVDAGPRLERLKLALGLRHVAIKVVEVAELLCAEAGVGIGWVVALVVLNVHVHAVLFSSLDQSKVVREGLDGGFGNHDVNTALDSIKGYGEVGGIRGEDGDGIAGGEGIDGRLVRFWINGLIVRERVEGGVQVVVSLGDVLVKMLAW